MIAKIVRGARVTGLLYYLFGPGRANEHTDPHLAAAWDPPATLEPAVVAGRHDLRHLAGMLTQPLLADFRAHPHPVWHCALRTAPGDRQLTDGEWDVVAREILDRAGIAPQGDPGGCRWVAVRHAEDHVHLIATLARQDGRSVSTYNDYYRVGQACRDIEDRFDLTRTGPRDRTAAPRPTRAETEKAQRTGKTEAPRIQLRRAVHSAAAITDSPAAFLAELRAAGVLVRERRSEQNPQEVTGFVVAWPGDHTVDGQPVWFGGSKLAPELSWARLTSRWNPDPTHTTPDQDDADPAPQPTAARRVDPRQRRSALHHATATARDAAHTLTGTSSTTDPGSANDPVGTDSAVDLDSVVGADDVAAAGGDLITVAGRLLEGRTPGTLSRIADRYQRAARVPYGRAPVASATAGTLRRAARDLARLGRARPSERGEVAELLRATASLVDALAELRGRQGRREQELAARETAAVLRTTAHTLQPPARLTTAPGSAVLAPVTRPRPPRSTA